MEILDDKDGEGRCCHYTKSIKYGICEYEGTWILHRFAQFLSAVRLQPACDSGQIR
jgi:hypothetical protein